MWHPDCAAPAHAYDVHLWDIAYTVRAGHRLRVDVTSSSFPKFEPNANSGRPLGSDTETDLRAALYPRAVVTGTFSARSQTMVRRNAALRPAYSFMLGLIALPGCFAVASHTKVQPPVAGVLRAH
ncbi:MAG: CocE/NonD family hydrolase C-terminal non-catalytic domain-containing protein [Candidatus Dormibacteria bacterium]